jgi:hypothetical protein
MSNAEQVNYEERAKLAKTILNRNRIIQGISETYGKFSGDVLYGDNVVKVLISSKFYIESGECKCRGLIFRNGKDKNHNPKGNCKSGERKCEGIFENGCEIFTDEMQERLMKIHKEKYPVIHSILQCHYKHHISGQPSSK